MSTSTVQDSIRRQITIDAPVDVVWRLVSTPGWWINDGEVFEHDTTVDGDTTTLHWKGADYPIRTLATDEPRSVAFQWGSGRSDETDAPRTRIDFTLEQAGDGVLVTVVESGFAAYADAAEATRTYGENVAGWEQELAAAKTALER